jgi:lipopolysaccharide export system permease protein
VRIFTRYILKEVLSYGLIGTSVFTFVVFMREVSRLLEWIVRNSAPVPSVAELVFLLLPGAFKITVPIGVLVGVLIGLSRMAADSEVTAMRASGVSVRTFLRILSIFGVAAWLIALFNTVVIEPRSAAALASLQKNMLSSQISFEVQPRVFYEEFKNYVLYVEDVSASGGQAVWKNVFLADISNPGTPKITTAKEATVGRGEKDSIRPHLHNAEEQEMNKPDSVQTYLLGELDRELPFQEKARPTQEAVPATQMKTPELMRAAYAANKDVARGYWIEFHRRFALPTACLVLVVMGIPLGLSARKGGKGAGFVLSIVLVFVYYFLYIVGLSAAKSGRVPPSVGVWMANAIFAIVGFALIWRTDKLPIEIGLGQSILSWFKNLGRTRAGGAERRGNGLRRQRWFNARFPLILDDYVLRTFTSNLLMVLASFLVLTLIFTFFELFTDIMRNKVAMTMVGEYLLNVVPSLLYLVTPLSVLLAVLITFGLMQKSNELTAMKATGISIYRTVVPILFIALALAGGLFLLDQWYLPYANKRVETLKNQIKGKPAQTYLRPDRKWIFGENNRKDGIADTNRKIYYYEFYDADRNQFGSISSFQLDPRTFQIVKRIYAARAHWSDNLQQWVFEKGWVRSWTYPAGGDPHEELQQFDVSTFAELTEPPSYFKKEVHQSTEMNYDELSSYIRDLQQSGFDVVRLRVQLQKKLAWPLITLVMAVLAVPFALSAAGKRGALSGIATALIIAVAYYITSGLFEALGNASQLPPLVAAWSPDVIFGLAGGYLIFKTPS